MDEMHLDPLLLSRLQFVWVIAWHILLPALTVGLASYIAVLEGMHFVSRKDVYLRSSMFWIKIFSVSFGMGVVSGIVMPFQFGTNWSRFSDITANIISPLLAYEGLTAFFLGAAFLGVLLFGRNLVPRWAHFVAALMVRQKVRTAQFTIDHLGDVLARHEDFCRGKTGAEKISPSVRWGLWWDALTANRRGAATM